MRLHVKLLTVVRVRGRDWISLFFCVAILISTIEVVGGPSTPPPVPAHQGSQSELNETAPLVTEIKTKTTGDNIEVFVKGWRPSSCHKTQEVFVSQEAEVTKIVIRMQKSPPPPNQLCTPTLEPMNIKVADLLKTQKASYKIMVLGHKGWHELDITHLMPAGL